MRFCAKWQTELHIDNKVYREPIYLSSSIANKLYSQHLIHSDILKHKTNLLPGLFKLHDFVDKEGANTMLRQDVTQHDFIEKDYPYRAIINNRSVKISIHAD